MGTDPDDSSSFPADLDGDGIPNDIDNDIDGDGVENSLDAFPNDATESSDLDGDGIGDNTDTDRDGDGFSNEIESQLATDPNDPASTPSDLDGDNIPDSLDDDRDGDGFTNELENQLGSDPNDATDTPSDIDGDNIPDSLDDDRDGDGVDNDQDAFPEDATESSDLDNDGIGDNTDTDRDGDGFTNELEEQLGTDPNEATDAPSDLDGDNIPDSLDDDRDGDGVNNDQDAFPNNANESSDLDGDGIGDNADTDRDGDGFSNADEAQVGTDPNDASDVPSDLDGDNIPDALDDDRDGDGINNDQDAFPEDANESSDLDGDGIGDNADTDRDGDGFSNVDEEQVGTDPNDATDVPSDIDEDNIPDSLDDDRDGDGVNNDQDEFPDDADESSDLDGDGIGDNADTDRDGDGFSNEDEAQVGTDPNDATDTPSDLDGDNIPDSLDDDRDGDGVTNDQDAFPEDATEASDLDDDGIGDNTDTDRDGDGFSNADEVQVGTDPNDAADAPSDLDGDNIPDSLDDDRDGDGVTNDQDIFPEDANESSDLDNDGIGDNADTDRDGDGFSNADEAQVGTDPNDAADAPSDLDGDNIPDSLDDDRDGDGVNNDQDAFPEDATESSDLDSDGIGDNADTDRDGDGFSNADEEQIGTDPNDTTDAPSDLDGDNIPDELDDDRDGDGVNNDQDAFPEDTAESSDLDSDGIGDNADTDRDGDGFSNADEVQVGTDPNDASDAPSDIDGDNIPDALDDDRDGDSVTNDQDAFPEDAAESSDLDSDGIGDNADTDRDGDGFSNVDEEQAGTDPNDASDAPSDIDGDNIPDALDDDRDGDGVNNDQDAFPDDGSESSDLDNDGIGDNTDTDRDGDGFSNAVEEQANTDPNDANDVPSDLDGDNIPDELDDDRDGDGVDDAQDAFPNDANESSDLDNDGIGDNADTDRDGDGFENEVEEQQGSNPNDATDTPSDLDGDNIPDSLDDDRDGDGVNNDLDAFPNNPNESSDLDEDGIGDNADTDRDGDGFSNEIEEQLGSDPSSADSTPPDADGDGIADLQDDDRDGDGVDNDQDAFPDDANESNDLDGDGVGDNADTDRDGDGFLNEDEISRGSDPDNASDFPDQTNPILSLTTEDQDTEFSSIVVIGTVSDPEQSNSGIASVTITSDRFPETSFSGSFSDLGEFEVEVPLQVGANVLTVTVTDLSDNQTQNSIEVNRFSAPQFVNVQPINGAVSIEDNITIQGEIHTLLDIDQLTFTINESQVTPISTQVAGVYRFDFPNVALTFGSNTFTLLLRSESGDDQRILNVDYVPDNAQNIAPPTIELIAPSNGSVLNQESFRISAEINSNAGPLTVSVDGQVVLEASEGLTFYTLSELLNFTDGASETSATIVAQDSLGRTSQLQPTFSIDNQSPNIVLDNNLIPVTAIDSVTAVNPVTQSPYLIAGVVSDDNLSSLLINNQSVSLSPSSNGNDYIFRAALPIAIGESLPVVLQAYDRSGNITEIEYILENVSTASIDVLSPATGTEFIENGEPVTTQVIARIAGLSGSESLVAYHSGSNTLIPFNINGDLASGDVVLQSGQPSQSIVLELRDSQGQPLTTATLDVTLLNQQDIPIELVRVEPINNAQFIEPNAPIELYFNREIDLSLLELKVQETLHGETYINNDPLGEDFISAEGFQLTTINRDLETVPGRLDLIPGNTGAVFNANRFFGYNAQLFVNVTYDGQELERFNFQVRELPTFINGSVIDQFGQPIRDIEVSIPELNRTTMTNGDGGFAFGYQEAGDQVIDDGAYQLQINADLLNPRFGSIDRQINVQRNRQNNLSRLILQELDRSISFYNLNSNRQNELIGGDLKIDLTNARALFNNGRTSGPVHAQFLPFEHIGVTTFSGAIPHWLFGIQPKGIQVEGDVSLRFKIPTLRNTYDYIDSDLYQYVILLGFNKENEVVEPIGVGIIDNLYVNSVGKVNLTSLNYLGYALPLPTQTDDLIRYANGEISLLQLKALIQVQ